MKSSLIFVKKGIASLNNKHFVNLAPPLVSFSRIVILRVSGLPAVKGFPEIYSSMSRLFACFGGNIGLNRVASPASIRPQRERRYWGGSSSETKDHTVFPPPLNNFIIPCSWVSPGMNIFGYLISFKSKTHETLSRYLGRALDVGRLLSPICRR